MNAEILAVGTEILLGDILNTDARFLSRQLSNLGINVFYQSVVGDNAARLENALTLALSRSDIVIMSGGLGPTYDDLTKETAAKLMGFTLAEDKESAERIKAFFNRMCRTMSDNNMKQAFQPVGGTIFKNNYGTAPGCAMEKDGKTIILLPGPPRELEPMFTEEVVPFLAKFSDGAIFSRTVRIIGMGESAVESRLKELMLTSTNPTIAPYAKTGEVELRVTAKAKDKDTAQSMIEPMIKRLKDEFGDLIYGVDVESLESVVVEMLKARKLKLAVAESCTGGLLAKRITDIAGSSEAFLGGVVAYDNSVKENLLGVKTTTLNQYGAVSRETAIEMARGAVAFTGADIGIGITGIAGPGGGSKEKPVGLVYVSLSDGEMAICHRLVLGRGGNERELVRYLSASNALDMVRRYVLYR